MPTFHSSYLVQRGHPIAPKPRAGGPGCHPVAPKPRAGGPGFGAAAGNRLSFTM
jgi:hypothetical protein